MTKNAKKIVFSFQLVGIIAFGVGFLTLLIGDIIGRVNASALGAPFDAIQAFGFLFGTIGQIFKGEPVSNVRLLALFGLVALLFICAFLFIKVWLEKVKGRLSIALFFVSALFLLVTGTVLKVGVNAGPNGGWLVLIIFSGLGFFVAVLCFGFRSLFAAGAKDIKESLSGGEENKDWMRELVREEINNQNQGDIEELRAIIHAELEDFKKNAAPTNIYVNMTSDADEKEEPTEKKQAMPVEEEPVEEKAEEPAVEEQAQEEPVEEAAPEEVKEEAPAEEEQPAEETPVEEAPVEEEQPAEEPAEEQPEEQPTEEPVEEQTQEEPAPEEQPAEEPAAEEPVAEEEQLAEEPAQEEASEPAEEEKSEQEAGDNGSTIPNTGKSRLSFEDKLADMDDELRAKYDELCSYIALYGIKSRISRPGNTYSLHRERYVFIAIPGRHLRVNFALDPEDYKDSTIPITVNTSNKFSDIPVVLKVRSDLSLKRAKMLVDDVMAKRGIEKGEYPIEDEEEEAPVEEAAPEEPVVEEPAPEEAPVEEAAPEEAPAEEAAPEKEAAPEEAPADEVPSNDGDAEKSASAIPNTGKSRVSFEDKLADMDSDLRAKYDELCDYIAQYGIKSRISRPGNTYSLHRERYVFIAIPGHHLRVNFALDPNDYKDSTIPVTENTSNKFSDIPVVLKVRSDLSLKRAKMLVDDVMAKRGIEKGAKPEDDE